MYMVRERGKRRSRMLLVLGIAIGAAGMIAMIIYGNDNKTGSYMLVVSWLVIMWTMRHALEPRG